MNWNLLEQLPETGGCRQHFITAIVIYMNAVRAHLNKTHSNAVIPALSQPTYGLNDESDIEYGKKLLSGEISQYLFK